MRVQQSQRHFPFLLGRLPRMVISLPGSLVALGKRFVVELLLAIPFVALFAVTIAGDWLGFLWLQAVIAAALVMCVFGWGGIPPSLPPLVPIFWLTVPLVGIVWDRWRGRSGILGGALAGAAEAGFALIWVITGPHKSGGMGPSYLANNPVVV